MPTVEQVWRLAMPPGTELVAGEDGVYNEVSWVVTLRPAPPAFDRLRGKELALINAAMARGLGITLPSLAMSLAEQGVSAVGVLGEVSSEARKEADRLRLPILHLPPGSDIRTVEGQTAGLIREERDRLYQREQELTREVMDLALAGRGVEAILRKLQDLTGRTIVLLGQDFESLVPPAPPVPGLQEVLSRIFPSRPSSITGVKLGKGISGFLSPVGGKPGAEEYLLVAAPSGDLQEADRLVARVGALSLAVETSRRQAVEDTEGKFQAEMVESLLSGGISLQAAMERARRLGLDLSQSHVALAAQAAGPGLKGPTIAKKMGEFFNKAVCHFRGDTLVVLLPVVEKATAGDLQRLGREVARKLSQYSNTPVAVGMGRRYQAPEGLKLSFQEAERALVVGKRLFGDGSVSLFSDLGIYRLLLTISPGELSNFYQESLGSLAEYDRKHGGELLSTLKALLSHPTLSETAQALHIHRNTLLYRLQRIQEIANLNLEDGDTRLALHLALKAGDVIRAG